MSVRARQTMAIVACAALLVLVVWATTGLPPFGHYPGPYGTLLDQVAPHERKIPNVVTAVNFDYRGTDTLGEEYILFAAIAGIALALRTERTRTTEEPLPGRKRKPLPQQTDAIRAFSVAGLAATVAFGIYLGIHAAETPGGGFQGGGITGGIAALVFLGLGYRTFSKTTPQGSLETLEALGAGAYAVIGLVTLIAAGAFLRNALPLGGEGELFSTGTIAVINLCVLLEVVAGFILLFLEFSHQTRVEIATEGEK